MDRLVQGAARSVAPFGEYVDRNAVHHDGHENLPLMGTEVRVDRVSNGGKQSTECGEIQISPHGRHGSLRLRALALTT